MEIRCKLMCVWSPSQSLTSYANIAGTSSNVRKIFYCAFELTSRSSGFYLSLAAYYVLGIPTAMFLAFKAKWGVTGLWTGASATWRTRPSVPVRGQY